MLGNSGPDFRLERHLFFWLTQVMGSRDRRLGQALRPFGVRVPEYRALAALYARQRCSMSELADLASIDRSTLSRTVERMRKAGWLTRLSDADDMRVTRLALTAPGERLFARLWPAVDELNRAAVAGLPAPAVEALRRALSRMKTNLDNEPAAGQRAA
jgi:MarR family transcriptional regulator, organic hydroperoxide resistance regulator